MTRKFLAKVIAELFPRVAFYAFPPSDFAFDRKRDRVTEREIRIPLDADKKCAAPGRNGVHYRLLGKSSRVSRGRRFRSSGIWRTSCSSKNRVETRRSRAYRPICLLDVEGKLFERVVASRIITHMGRTKGETNSLRINTASGRADPRLTRSFESETKSGKLCAGAESRSRFLSTLKTRSISFRGTPLGAN